MFIGLSLDGFAVVRLFSKGVAQPPPPPSTLGLNEVNIQVFR